MGQQILLLFCIGSLIFAASAEDGDYVRVTKFEQCTHIKDTLIQLKELDLKWIALNKFTISGKTVVRENVPGPIKMVVEISKCSGIDREDKYEHIFSPTIDDLCEEMERNSTEEERNSGNFLRLFGLKAACPIEAGSYTFTPTEFKLDYLQDMMVNFGKYWKVSVSLMDAQDNVNFCIYSEAEVVKPEKKRSFNRFQPKTTGSGQ